MSSGTVPDEEGFVVVPDNAADFEVTDATGATAIVL